MRVFRPFLALVAPSLLVILLAGCGATASAQAVNDTTLQSLYVTHTTFDRPDAVPFEHGSVDVAAIARLYDAINALPPFSTGIINCPADGGELYHLTFTRTDGTKIMGLAKPDGCSSASVGGGPAGMIVDGNGFWSTFAAALDMPQSALPR